MDAARYRNDVLVSYWPDETSYREWANGEFAAWWSAPERLAGDTGYWCRSSAPLKTIGKLCSRAMIGRPDSLPWAHDCSVRWRSTATGVARATVSRFPRGSSWMSIADSTRASEPLSPAASAWATRTRLRHSFGAGLDRLPVAKPISTGRVYPVLIRGMDYLRDHPCETGCFSCASCMSWNLTARPPNAASR